MTDPVAPVACSLSAGAAADQLSAWAQLARSCISIEDHPPGRFVARFHASAEAAVRAVAEAEQACCRFLDITLTREGDQTVLAIGAEDPAAQPVLQALRAALTPADHNPTMSAPQASDCQCCAATTPSDPKADEMAHTPTRSPRAAR